MTTEITIIRAAITAAALSLVNVPFRHHGRDESLGLDCAGVLVATFRKLGITLQELPVNYRRLPAESHVLTCLEMNFRQIPWVNDAAVISEGNIAHIKFKRDSEARHLGIYVESQREPMLVHALRSNGRVVLEPLRGVLTQATMFGVWEYPYFPN